MPFWCVVWIQNIDDESSKKLEKIKQQLQRETKNRNAIDDNYNQMLSILVQLRQHEYKLKMKISKLQVWQCEQL